MAEPSRIDQLRRRVQQDPASIAFAQLAEECRRAGDFEEAVRVARAGLEQHPGYLSARVTLGRALIDLGRFDEAEPELETVVGAAPDNLAAIRALADIHQHRGELPADSESTEPVAPTTPAHLADEESFERALAGLDASLGTPALAEPAPAPPIPDTPTSPPPPVAPEQDPVLETLEAWHAAIVRDRQSRDNSR